MTYIFLFLFLCLFIEKTNSDCSCIYFRTGGDNTCTVGANVENSKYELRCVGDNAHGQLGANTKNPIIELPVVLYNGDVSHQVLPEFGCGDSFCCFTQVDTLDLYCMGKNDYGQLGIDEDVSQTNDPKYVISNVIHISTGQRHACAIDNKHDLYCWGDNSRGQISDKDVIEKSLKPILVDRNITFVEAAATHTCAIRKNGTVTCWGANFFGQLGNNEDKKNYDTHLNKTVLGVSNAEKMSCSHYHCCVIETTTYWSNNLKCWGKNDYCQTYKDCKEYDKKMEPVLIKILETTYRIISLSLANQHTCVALDNGYVYCWGDNSDNHLCSLEDKQFDTPTSLNIQDVLSVKTTDTRIMFLKKNGKLWSCGKGTKGVLGTGDEEPRYELSESDVLCRGTPTKEPTKSPTRSPTTRPSNSPSMSPTTGAPSTSPTTSVPSTSPTDNYKKEDVETNQLMIAFIAIASTVPVFGTVWAIYGEFTGSSNSVKYTLIDY